MYKYIIIISILSIFFSCKKENIIYYDISSGYNEGIEELKSTPHPNFILEDISTINLNNRQELRVIKFSKKEISSNINRSDLILRRYSTAIVHHTNPLDDIDLKDISKYQLIPLKDVEMPKKALSINGLYPSDVEYPLITEVFLERLNIKSPEVNLWLDRYVESKKENIERQPKIYWIGAVGDMMLNRGVDTLLRNKGINSVFTNTLPVLQSFDLLLGNLEGAVTDRGLQNSKSFTFRFKQDLLPYLTEVGFDYLSIANNHIYDFGEIGFKDTLINLKEYNIPTSGAGLTIKEASDFYEVDNIRILSIASFPNEKNGYDGYKQSLVTKNRAGILFNSDISDNAIKKMCSDSTFDIVYVHGGTEWAENPSLQQKTLYKKYIDMGVDLVLGSHPHVLQKIEPYKKGFIAYSLGNFIFPLMTGWYTGEESMILSIGLINNQIVYSKVYPVNIDNKTISLDQSGYIKNRFYNLK
ncbi:MAG: CapA family protein [Spirochaetaceae bacterium]